MALNQWTEYRNAGSRIGIGVRIKHDPSDVANNRTRVYYQAFYYRIAGYNWYENPYTGGKLTIYGQVVYDNSSQLVDLYTKTEHVVKTGDMWVPHLSNGTRQIAYNFTHDGSRVPPIDASIVVHGGYELPNIPRTSIATLSKTTFNFGESITVTTNRNDASFTHNIFYVRNGIETSLSTGVGVSGAIAIPNSLMTSYPNTTSANLSIRVKTYSGANMIGSYDISVNVNIPSSITPNITGVAFTGSNAIFTANTQFIRDIDRLKATGSGVSGSNGSTVATYQYRIVKGTTVMANMSSSANGATFPVFSFPNSGSDVYEVQMKVVDSRGRESAWVSSAAIRVHYYRAPIIGNMSVSRVGAANTTFQARRNHTVTSLLESGQAAQQKNTASLQFRYRTRGATAWINNGTVVPVTGANSIALSLVDSDANLVGAFSANTSYEVQAVLSDKLNTVYSSVILVGGQFLPFSLHPKGAGVGKMHSGGAFDLEVGSGGIHSEGSMSLGGNLNMGQHNRVSSAPIRINFGGINDHYRAVIALSNLSVDGSHSIGKVMASRVNGLYGATQADVTFTSMYNRNAVNADVINYGPHQLKVCTFKYGGVTYGGLELYPTNAQYDYVEFHGMSNMNPFMVKYYDTRGTALNSEINNSISYTENIERSGSLLYGNNKMWHAGNDGSGSGLDADLLDGKHASAFALASNTTSYEFGSNDNGNYHILGNGLMICTQRMYLGNYLSGFTIMGRWTFPSAFKYIPTISVTPITSWGNMTPTPVQEDLNGTLQLYTESATYADMAWIRTNGNAFVNGSKKYIALFAIGVPA